MTNMYTVHDSEHAIKVGIANELHRLVEIKILEIYIQNEEAGRYNNPPRGESVAKRLEEI